MTYKGLGVQDVAMRCVGGVFIMVVAASGVCFAAVSPAVPADVSRGLAAVGARDSDAPALRQEAATHPPSDGFAAGAALGAWRNASAGLAHDVAHPMGDGGEAQTLRGDCFDETMAFAHLEAASARLWASPRDVVSAAGLSDDAAAAWMARRRAAPGACG
jgi:hypothetical protein